MRFLPFRVAGRDADFAQMLNDILARLRAQRPMSSPSVKVKESASGTTFEVKVTAGGAAGPPAFQLMKVVADPALTGGINAPQDYILCNQVTWIDNHGVSGGVTVSPDVVNVAKPFYLRSSPYGAATIHPPYVYAFKPYNLNLNAPQYIYATKAITGGTGVFADGAELEWIDANFDARSWAYLKDVCINGVAGKQNFVASDVYIP